MSIRFHYDGVRLTHGYTMAQLLVVHKILSKSVIVEPNGHNDTHAAYRNCQAASVSLLLSDLHEDDILIVLDHWSAKQRGLA